MSPDVQKFDENLFTEGCETFVQCSCHVTALLKQFLTRVRNFPAF